MWNCRNHSRSLCVHESAQIESILGNLGRKQIMKTRPLLITCLIVLLCGSAGLAAAEQTLEQAPAGLQSTDARHFGTEDRPPNIVYIMADELAYYELSHMGNPHIRTPNIDRLAKQGIRYTQALAAAPVCAPLRCALMTGKHMGHASVRANGGGTPLRQDEETIASLLKQKGYATGGFGKWGAGGRDSTGVPEKHGFDVFFGYYDQVHAHSFYPPYLIRNSEEVKLDGNIGGRSGETYSHYAIMDEALNFIRDNKDQPFFCYLPITPPHGMYDIPADDPAWQLYKNDQWIQDPSIKDDVKNYAAMVSMVDHNVQQVLDLLKELGLEENTIVFFTGDNGGQDRFRDTKHPRGFFGPNVNPQTGVEFRGGKGNLYEGGLRIPFIARWPGKIKPGQVSDLLFYQIDVLPTLVELTGANQPSEVDGLSILPSLLGEKTVGHAQQQHPFLYWEFGPQTAVRVKNWKGIQPKRRAEWELYDLSQDPSEQHNLAEQQPDLVKQMKQFAVESHEPVRSGRFTSEVRHQRDRQAKWGTAKQPPRPRRGKPGKPNPEGKDKLTLESSPSSAAPPQKESPRDKGLDEDEFIVQKLTPLETEAYRLKKWFFWQDNTDGDFTWIISKEKAGEENRPFETGYQIKAFYDVSKKAKKSPEDFAAEYLETSFGGEKMKLLHRAEQKAGPLTAITQTMERADGITATDLYWGDGQQLDVVVVITRKAPKNRWNVIQPVFGKLNFNLRTIVQGTRDKARVDSGKGG